MRPDEVLTEAYSMLNQSLARLTFKHDLLILAVWLAFGGQALAQKKNDPPKQHSPNAYAAPSLSLESWLVSNVRIRSATVSRSNAS